MKKSYFFLTAGLVLTAGAYTFIYCVLFLYGGSSALPLPVLYGLYGLYLAATGAMFALSIRFARKENPPFPRLRKVLTGIGLFFSGILDLFLVYLFVHLLVMALMV